MDTKNIDGMNSVERCLKRTGDLVGAFLLLILFSPVFLVIYIVQKIENKGPVIFKQERIGKGGKPFKILKFRTMQIEAEQDGVPRLATEGDKRIDKSGLFLREHHLDELPQLWNVLVGDMSFVGYRPERLYFITQIMEHNPDYALLFVSRPGVTSNATLHNGYTDTMEKMLLRLDMDLDYLRRRSIGLDIKIIVETAFSIIGGKKF
ncbi:MAG: sugar transferase [Roseburia sp.]|nr:sugar transferase [Roseburia sp.]MCM1419982.1 sugar transferase [Bacteroides sp.]